MYKLAHLSSQGTKLSKKQKIQHPKDVGAQNIHINNENGIRTIGSSDLPKDFLAEPYTGTSITNYTDIPRSSNTGVSDNEGIGYEDFHTAHVAQNDIVATMQSTSTVSAPLNEICATDQSGNAYSCHSAQTQPFNMMHRGPQLVPAECSPAMHMPTTGQLNDVGQQNIPLGTHMNSNAFTEHHTSVVTYGQYSVNNTNPNQINWPAVCDQAPAGPSLSNNFGEVVSQLQDENVQTDKITDTYSYENRSSNEGHRQMSEQELTEAGDGNDFHQDTEHLDDDEDFTEYIRKPPKRLFIGGFTADVSTEKISRYINKRGPTVTWISAWPSNRNPNNAIIRVNVVDNHACSILLDKSFWPKGVICKPWKNRYPRYRNEGYNSQGIYGRSDII